MNTSSSTPSKECSPAWPPPTTPTSSSSKAARYPPPTKAAALTRDIDFAATGLPNEAEAVLQLIRQIAQIPMNDGLTYDSETANVDIIRDEDQYSGVRAHLPGSLA